MVTNCSNWSVSEYLRLPETVQNGKSTGENQHSSLNTLCQQEETPIDSLNVSAVAQSCVWVLLITMRALSCQHVWTSTKTFLTHLEDRMNSGGQHFVSCREECGWTKVNSSKGSFNRERNPKLHTSPLSPPCQVFSSACALMALYLVKPYYTIWELGATEILRARKVKHHTSPLVRPCGCSINKGIVPHSGVRVNTVA